MPKIKLDDVFEKKDEIADIVKSELAQVMEGFGYRDIGASSRTNAILIPHSPGSLASLTDQMRNAMIEADQVRVEPAPGTLAELRRAFDGDHIEPDAPRRELAVEAVGV